MKRLTKIIFLALGLTSLLTPVDAASASDELDESSIFSSSESQWEKSRFSLEFQMGSRSIGTLDALIRFCQS